MPYFPFQCTGNTGMPLDLYCCKFDELKKWAEVLLLKIAQVIVVKKRKLKKCTNCTFFRKLCKQHNFFKVAKLDIHSPKWPKQHTQN